MDCFGKTKPLIPDRKLKEKEQELFDLIESMDDIDSEKLLDESLFILEKDMQLDCPVCSTKGFLSIDRSNRPGFLEVVYGYEHHFEAVARCKRCGHHFAEWMGDHWEGEGRVISHEAPAWRKFRTVVDVPQKTKELYSSLFRAARSVARIRTEEVVRLRCLLIKLRDIVVSGGCLSQEDSVEIDNALGEDYPHLSINRREEVKCR